MYIADASMMKEIDRYTIEEIGIPSMVLMENASRSVVKNIVNIVSSSELFNAHILRCTLPHFLLMHHQKCCQHWRVPLVAQW